MAGGGTGETTARLAQQLQKFGCPSEVSYLDLSTASCEVAEQRAKTYSLDNLMFHSGSLLDLPEMDCGKFDYIDCSGVLHQLTEPSIGSQSSERRSCPVGWHRIDALWAFWPSGHLSDSGNHASIERGYAD
jgi:SAM-dependent methyltransferase